MNRNYETPRVDAEWASSRNTHIAVATAIHAIADTSRNPESIWEAPTPTEWSAVTAAVAEYVAHGDYANEADGYAWGCETIRIEHEPTDDADSVLGAMPAAFDE
jgi:hypothetical protein